MRGEHLTCSGVAGELAERAKDSGRVIEQHVRQAQQKIEHDRTPYPRF